MSYQRLLASIICGLSTTTVLAEAKFPCKTQQALVTKSNSPKYAVNTCLSDNLLFPLKDGEQLVLQGHHGKTILVNGSTAIADLIKLIKRLVKSSGQRAPSQNIDWWAIDATGDSAFCFKPTQKLFLQREDASHTETVIFTSTDQEEKSVTYLWKTGQTHLTWPKELPVTDKAAYFVEIQGQATRELTFYQIPETQVNAELANWMGNQGCERQADKLLEVPKGTSGN